MDAEWYVTNAQSARVSQTEAKDFRRKFVDVFSWFRQKRQGIRPLPFDEIRIPLMATPTFGLVVYCRLGEGGDTRPEPDDLLPLALAWTDTHVQEPMRSAIREFIDRGLLNLFIHDREEMPEPPDDILRAYNPGEIEERRFRNATHAIVVGAPDLLAPPRIGLWSVLASARGIAAGLRGGVLVDPEFPRLLGLEALTQDLPADGHVCVPEHILIPYSTDSQTGQLWITTKGMTRFGLPEIEICDAPPNLANSLMPVMNGLAQRLVDVAMSHVDAVGDDEDAPEYLAIPSQFHFGLSDIRAAYEFVANADWTESVNSLHSDGSEPTAVIRLEMAERQHGEDSFVECVRLLPPRGLRSGMGVWLNRLLSALLGSDAQIEAIEANDEAMQEAHREARETFPQVRERFREGFRSGEVLHIKHGFLTETSGREYMWIAVTSWEDGKIRGHIANEPQYRRDLNAGQVVEIDEDEIYDWMIAHTDGRIEGAYTNRVLDHSDGDTSGFSYPEYNSDSGETSDGYNEEEN